MNDPNTVVPAPREVWRRLSPHEGTAGGRAVRRVIVGMGYLLLVVIVLGWVAVIRHIGIDTLGGGGLAAAGLGMFLLIRIWRRRMAAFDLAMGTPALWVAGAPHGWGTTYFARIELTPRNLPDRTICVRAYGRRGKEATAPSGPSGSPPARWRGSPPA